MECLDRIRVSTLDEQISLRTSSSSLSSEEFAGSMEESSLTPMREERERYTDLPNGFLSA